MKIIRQFTIILAVSFTAEILHYFIRLPIPASVYGLVIMLLLLFGGVIKVEQVEEVGDFFLNILPILFVAPCVSLLTVIGDHKKSIPIFLLVAVLSTIVVTGVTGWVSQALVSASGKEKNEKTKSEGPAGSRGGRTHE